MKKAFGWTITGIGVLCFVFFSGLFIGRRSIEAPENQNRTTAFTVDYTVDVSNLEKININTADAGLLQQLPGIGETLALRIIAYRDQHGPFTDPRQLDLVEGIGDGKIIDIIELICVED